MTPWRKSSPQENKKRSYARDGRNSYRENDKASRKNVPRAKARGERRLRRAVNQALNAGDQDAADVASHALRTEGFVRDPDRSLAEHLERPFRPAAGDPGESLLRDEAKRRVRRRR